jgi:hypothetical protein
MTPENEIRITLPIETFWAAQKGGVSNLLTCVSNPATPLVVMPNQHSPDKICISAWVGRPLHRRLTKAAKARKMTLTDYAEHLYAQATREIELTAEDFRQIAEAVERAKRKSSARVASPRRTPRKAD